MRAKGGRRSGEDRRRLFAGADRTEPGPAMGAEAGRVLSLEVRGSGRPVTASWATSDERAFLLRVESGELSLTQAMDDTTELAVLGNCSPAQHWPGPGGTHANAAVNVADTVTSATAKIGINIMGFIVVSSNRPG